ncbi:MAG: hypothetical protein QXF82_07920 [Nitrososphaeria archaeon]
MEVKPNLKITIEVDPIPDNMENIRVEQLVLFNLSGVLKISNSRSSPAKWLGPLFPYPSSISLVPRSKHSISFYHYMDAMTMQLIEGIREGKELWVSLEQNHITATGLLIGKRDNQTTMITDSTELIFSDPFYRIVRDDWLAFLEKTGLKRIRILEVSELANKDLFKQPADYLDSAWRFFYQGEYDQVLSECRRSIQSLGDVIRSQGFEKKMTEGGEEKPMPDWNRYFDSETIGDTIATINKKLYSFSSPAAHPTKKVFNRADAEFLLFSVYSILNYVSRSHRGKRE